MRKVILYSLLLIAGLIGSQFIPGLLGDARDEYALIVRILTMTALSFIMIHVGFEFDIDKKNVRQYGVDYLVAATAAAFPWIFVCLYFVFVMLPSDLWSNTWAWKESLLASRFAAPTSAGVLFSMLAAAGLAATWLFRKARILAIFDDLDTVLLMIPLKMMMVGMRWQLGIIVIFMAAMLWLAWKFLHAVKIPISWPWVIGYSLAIVGVSEVIYVSSKMVDATVPIHLEVLLPAFVLGCMIARPPGTHVPHEGYEGEQPGPDNTNEQRVSSIVSAVFMVLVGLSMPVVIGAAPAEKPEGAPQGAGVLASIGSMSAGAIALHVLLVTVLSNLGKMLPAFCYRSEAPWRTRLALSIGMWPRGEVGAGVLVVSLSYGIGGPIVTVAMLSLALNLILTGVFIVIIKRLIAEPARAA